jgi:hypothetical protein
MKQIATTMAIIILALSCAHSPGTIQIQEKVSEFYDVNTFANWLEEQPNIGRVNVNKLVLLTSDPPKVVVTYYQKNAIRRLLLSVKPGYKLVLVKPE